MLGLPKETPKKAMKTIRLAIELDLSTAAFRMTYPEYGTKLYDLAVKEGKFVDGWQKMNKASYIPSGYKGTKELESMQKLAFKKFYFRPKYFIKRLMMIKSFEDLKRNIEGIKFLLGIV
jgi:radical SAM superfamily enzyme YgiQ (UPF0313 family)